MSETITPDSVLYYQYYAECESCEEPLFTPAEVTAHRKSCGSEAVSVETYIYWGVPDQGKPSRFLIALAGTPANLDLVKAMEGALEQTRKALAWARKAYGSPTAIGPYQRLAVDMEIAVEIVRERGASLYTEAVPTDGAAIDP